MNKSEPATFLPFARPSIGDAEVDEITRVLESGWLTTGPRTAQFEADLAAYFGRGPVHCVSSATAGLHAALAALDLQPGDEVVTTPLTFVASLNTIVLAGGTPVLADVEPGTLNIDPERLAAAIGPRTRAIMPVHFAGLPVDLDAVYALAKKHGLRVVEDCAHAIGAEFKGKRIGGFGDIQVFSFHPNKNITTGEGGAVVSEDAEVMHRIAQFRFHGIDREAFNRFARSGSQHYDVVRPGYKYNMLDMQAALGLHQLPKLDGFIERRRQIVERYHAALADQPGLTLPAAPGFAHKHAWHLFTPLVNEEVCGLDRDGFMAALKARGIGTGLHYTAAHLFTYYRETFGFHDGQFPVAEDICKRIVSLPLFPDMTDAQQDFVIDALLELVAANQGAR